MRDVWSQANGSKPSNEMDSLDHGSLSVHELWLGSHAVIWFGSLSGQSEVTSGPDAPLGVRLGVRRPGSHRPILPPHPAWTRFGKTAMPSSRRRQRCFRREPTGRRCRGSAVRRTRRRASSVPPQSRTSQSRSPSEGPRWAEAFAVVAMTKPSGPCGSHRRLAHFGISPHLGGFSRDGILRIFRCLESNSGKQNETPSQRPVEGS